MVFSVNIVTMDFFMSKPTPHFDTVHSPLRNSVVLKVPVIRIFGNDTQGKKACVFVHGVFPYLYIPLCSKSISEREMQQIAASIDKALNTALGYKDSVQHVFHVAVCEKIPMYGYHEGTSTYLKIFLYEPYHVGKLEDLLLSGAVCNERFQPHESHVPYILQFSMDYNLYGMSHISFQTVKFRSCLETSLPKLTFCELEADVKVEYIIVDLSIGESNMKNPGIHAIWKDEENRRHALNKRGTITPQSSQVRFGTMHNTEKIFTEKLMKNIKSYRRQNRSILSVTSLDDTVVQDDINCTLDAMILDQLNELAEDNTQRDGIDKDSILGTQVREEEPGEDWTNELELYYEVDVTMEEETPEHPNRGTLVSNDSTCDNSALKPESNSSSQDIFGEINLEDTKKNRKSADDQDTLEKLNQSKTLRDKVPSVASVMHAKKTDHPTSNTSSLFSKRNIIKPHIFQTEKVNPSSESDLFITVKSKKSPVEFHENQEKQIISTKSNNFTLTLTSSSQKKDEILAIKLKCKPISRATIVEELIQNNVTNILSSEPFYSNMQDVHRSELNNKHLHLEDAPIDLLEEHKSQFSTLTQLRQHVSLEITGILTKNVNNVISNYYKFFPFNCKFIKPTIKPPSPKSIKRWLLCKEALNKDTEIKSKSKAENKVSEKRIDSPYSSQKDMAKQEYFEETTSIDPSMIEGKATTHTLFENVNPATCTLQIKSSAIDMMINTEPVPETSHRKPDRSSFDAEMGSSSPSREFSHTSQSTSNVTSNNSINCDLFNSFIRRQLETPKRLLSDSYAIETVTPNTTGDFQIGLDNLNQVSAHVENYYLTVLVVEIHAISRALLKPDPAYDEVKALFYYLYTSPPEEVRKVGIILIGQEKELSELRNKPVQVSFVPNEKELFITFIEKVRQWDPDILMGYEIETLSWGYLLERGYILELNMNHELSRLKKVEKINLNQEEIKSSSLQVVGRIIINLWRLLRHELTLQSYTFENMMYHVLHERVPLHSFKILTSWWEHRTKLYKWMTVDHYLVRVTGIIRLMEQLDIIGRTSEMARLFGIQFYEVLSRGSQFRVESMMLRLARLNNFIALSPSVKQRARMRAPESLPLILEPESKLYTDPVIVLDFQSLYPSVIIAYNYCFSTCLGRVEHLGVMENFPYGCVDLNVSIDSLKKLQQSLSISPSGVAFVSKSVRCGILPQMLQEILDTRLMVKQSMKDYKKNNALQRVLHARQLGLKLIANVTYGYTAANFSGRMPCVEVGDSVVSKGRETLQKAIETVNNTAKWQCRVVYGDTDSMFVHAPGKTKEEAFEIGKEIADAVTKNNPTPVKLKFEKVYQPCILQTKKRYVGFMYESIDQEKPIYEAKGIETVRRDGCPAVSKILKKSLCLLFQTKNLSAVKEYVEKQFKKIISGRISVQDMTFAKEYRGQAGYKPGACVPALSLARNWVLTDVRSEPRVGERVPYVIVSGAPGLPLIKLVKNPHELLQDFSLRINSEYYITRVIVPPLERCFFLLGTPVMPWYTSLPRKFVHYLPSVLNEQKKKSTISQYFACVNCVCCNEITQNKKGVCDKCLNEPQLLATCLYYKVQAWQRSQDLVSRLCVSCLGHSGNMDCISLDCPVLYKRTQIRRDLEQLPYVLSLCGEHLSMF